MRRKDDDGPARTYGTTDTSHDYKLSMTWAPTRLRHHPQLRSRVRVIDKYYVAREARNTVQLFRSRKENGTARTWVLLHKVCKYVLRAWRRGWCCALLQRPRRHLESKAALEADTTTKPFPPSPLRPLSQYVVVHMYLAIVVVCPTAQVFPISTRYARARGFPTSCRRLRRSQDTPRKSGDSEGIMR